MWDSLKLSLREYIVAWGRWAWWLVVGVILVLVDVYLKATDQTLIPPRVWVALGFIVLIFVPFIVFHKSRLERESLRREIVRLTAQLAQGPSVSIEADSDDIFVLNRGATATFRAEIRIMDQWNFDKELVGKAVAGFWHNGRGPKTELFHGQQDRLYLRSFAPTPAPGGAVTGTLALHYYNPQGATIDAFRRPLMLYSTDPPIEAGLLIQVMIISAPEMADGPVFRTYRLATTGLSTA